MLTPIVCFTCGCSLGDIAPVYHAVRRKRMALRHGAEAAGAAPTEAAIDPTLTENTMGDVLEALQVSKCCRTRLATAMIFSEHY